MRIKIDEEIDFESLCVILFIIIGGIWYTLTH